VYLRRRLIPDGVQEIIDQEFVGHHQRAVLGSTEDILQCGAETGRDLRPTLAAR
jgi:hypothetical protein